jgi:hypothetical protein
MDIKFELENKRAAIYDDGKEIGVCTFEESGDSWAITHTIVSSEYRGMGLAKQVLECVLKNAEERGKEIIPICSYAVKYMEKNNE